MSAKRGFCTALLPSIGQLECCIHLKDCVQFWYTFHLALKTLEISSKHEDYQGTRNKVEGIEGIRNN